MAIPNAPRPIEDDDATADFSTSTGSPNDWDLEDNNLDVRQQQSSSKQGTMDEEFHAANTKVLLFMGVSTVATMTLLVVLALSGLFDSEKAQEDI